MTSNIYFCWQSAAMEHIIVEQALHAGLRGREQPRTIFSAVLPQTVLDDTRTRCGIIPDAMLRVPRGFPRQRSGGAAEPVTDTLFDIKCLHDGAPAYVPTRASLGRRQQGVVRRAASVHRDYEISAMHLDTTHHSVPAQGRPLRPVGGPGPVLTTLLSFPHVRGLAFGPRADASPDVHALVRFMARSAAQREWRLMGSRTAAEAGSFLTTMLQRTIGIAAMRGEAELRCRRAQQLGASRGNVRAMADGGDPRPPQVAGGAPDDFDRGLHPRHGWGDRH